MDPISVIGLLASLSSLIQASNTLLNVMRSIKDAEKEILELYNDVSVFEEALKGFDRVLRSRQTRHNISTDVIDNALQEGSATIQDLGTRLVQIFKCKVSAVRRIKWAQQKSSLKWAHERLKGQSTMLQSFLALAHALVALFSSPATSRLIQSTAKPFWRSAVSIPSFFSSTRPRRKMMTTTPCLFRDHLFPSQRLFILIVPRRPSVEILWTLLRHPSKAHHRQFGNRHLKIQ